MNFYLKYCLELRRSRMSFSTQKGGKNYEIQKLIPPAQEMKNCRSDKGKNNIFFLNLDLFIFRSVFFSNFDDIKHLTFKVITQLTSC